MKGEITTWLTRVRNQPLKKRFYQSINGLIVQLAGRPVKVSHLLEYPKCGGTWVRNMMQTYLGGKPYLVNQFVKPKTVIHLHRKFSERFSYPVVLFRDPRDVYVSYYFYEKALAKKISNLAINNHMKFGVERDYKNELSQYLSIKLTKLTDPYFTYKQFVESWHGRENVCYVLYENFHIMPVKELTKIIEFLGEEVDNYKVENSIESNSFQNVTLRKYGKSRMPGEEDTEKFQRKGVSGDWVNHFNDESCDIMKKHMGDVIIKLGYESNSSWNEKILIND